MERGKRGCCLTKVVCLLLIGACAVLSIDAKAQTTRIVSKNGSFYIDLKDIAPEVAETKEGFTSVFIMDKTNIKWPSKNAVNSPSFVEFTADDLNRMSAIVHSDYPNSITLDNGVPLTEFPDDKILISQKNLRPIIWHIGATLRFVGKFEKNGYTFVGEGSKLERLTFIVDEAQVKYKSGKGRVVMKDGREIKLGL